MEVKVSPSKNGYKVEYSGINKFTNAENKHSFHITFRYKKMEDLPTIRQLENLIKYALNNLDKDRIIGTSKKKPPQMTIREVKQYIMAYIRMVYRTEYGREILKKMDSDEPPQTLSESKHNINNRIQDAKEFPKNESIFKPESSAKTFCLLGSSFSGKTTLLVNELNKLDKNDYTRIFLFTESLHAAPLKKLRKDLKINIYDAFNPVIPKVLRKINIQTNNRYNFLVILDDVVSGLKKETMTKMILTMRNSNISTCILLQYAKLIGPQQRNSIHEYYITKLRVDDWIYMLKGFLAQHFRDVLNEPKANYQKLAEIVKEVVSPHSNVKDFKNGYIVKYDQRKDEISFYKR